MACIHTIYDSHLLRGRSRSSWVACIMLEVIDLFIQIWSGSGPNKTNGPRHRAHAPDASTPPPSLLSSSNTTAADGQHQHNETSLPPEEDTALPRAAAATTSDLYAAAVVADAKKKSQRVKSRSKTHEESCWGTAFSASSAWRRPDLGRTASRLDQFPELTTRLFFPGHPPFVFARRVTMLRAPGRVALLRYVCIPRGKVTRAPFSAGVFFLGKQTSMHRHGRSHAAHLHPQRRLQSFGVFSPSRWFFPRVSARPAGRWGVRDTSSPALSSRLETQASALPCVDSRRGSRAEYLCSRPQGRGACATPCARSSLERMSTPRESVRAALGRVLVLPAIQSWDPLAHMPCLLYFVATRASALVRGLLVVSSRRVRQVDRGALVELSPAFRVCAGKWGTGDATCAVFLRLETLASALFSTQTSAFRRGLSDLRACGLVAARAPGGSLGPKSCNGDQEITLGWSGGPVDATQIERFDRSLCTHTSVAAKGMRSRILHNMEKGCADVAPAHFGAVPCCAGVPSWLSALGLGVSCSMLRVLHFFMWGLQTLAISEICIPAYGSFPFSTSSVLYTPGHCPSLAGWTSDK
ncbi:hypothetical protein C8J57DRAFT_1236718 [Mycena rebaudengoi]|nr:hypothetical protein C8J57DRAFT_1236718 [Mycena rebaudengoi]